VTWLTDIGRWLCHRAAMSKLVTQAELLEIVPELRAMAAAEPADNVREALNRLVDRYAAMGREAPCRRVSGRTNRTAVSPAYRPTADGILPRRRATCHTSKSRCWDYVG
jgi:hypothetical protein